jgi:2C-methyl-D-erythritol 2,4-cyclodiphosphate synthase
VGNFHVKDQHKHLGVIDGEVTSLGNKKAMISWLLKGVIGHVVEVLDKIVKKDVKKGLLLGNYDGVEVEEYNATNFDTNEDFMPPSNHQYVGEPTGDMLQANNMGQL